MQFRKLKSPKSTIRNVDFTNFEVMNQAPFVLSSQNSIASNYLAEMRSLHTQNDRLRFRRNCERLGEILAYEISKNLSFKEGVVQTPLAQKEVNTLADQPVIVSILRAGVPFHMGFSNVFDNANHGFIGAYRAPEEAGKEVSIKLEYAGVPSLEGRTLILVDPMLATGSSIIQSKESLLRFGKPSEIHIAAIIAAQDGVDKVRSAIPEAKLWIGDIDPILNEKFYIVPGLGDAGDLCFGPKLSLT